VIPNEIREYAETPDRFAGLVAGSSASRYDDGRICIVQGPTWGSVSAPNVAPDELEALVAEVRTRIPRDTTGYVWWIGPSARPVDIVERLQALGFAEPQDRVGLLHAMALTHEPDAMPTGIEVRRVETLEDFVAAREVQWDAFDTPQARRALNRARLRDDFEESTSLQIPVGFLATLDGRPAATGMLIPSERGVFLIAGATAAWARGRGLYRALVRARWDYAVARGTPALVTHADPATSYPILQRLGFTEVCTLRRLEDPAAR
jgi:predicted N-acetyltransferase YhbS